MKTTLLKIITFPILLVLILYALGIPNNEYVQKKDIFYNNFEGVKTANAHTIILGDSHAGDIPQDLFPEGVYNFAVDSDSVHDMFVKLIYALKYNPNLKTVILTADYHIFSKYRHKYNNQELMRSFISAKVYKQIYNEPVGFDPIGPLLRRYPFFDVKTYVTKRKELLTNFKNRLERSEKDSDVKSLWFERTVQERLDITHDRIQFQLQDLIHPASVLRYGEIVKLCRQKNIRLIGLRYPLAPIYRDLVKIFDVHRVDSLYEKFPFDQYIDASDFTADLKHYRDMDHLNRAGSELFVPYLMQKTSDSRQSSHP